MEDFDKVIEELQASIIKEARKIYPEKMIEHWLEPKNLCKMDNPNGFARITGPCGDTMEISLNVKNDTIINANFMTDGCASTIACGSICTELANSKSIEDALNISKEVILESLGGLPKEYVHCALLASNTLRKAIQNYLSKTQKRIKE
jgi:nitrogen fixation NifU-like protein